MGVCDVINIRVAGGGHTQLSFLDNQQQQYYDILTATTTKTYIPCNPSNGLLDKFDFWISQIIVGYMWILWWLYSPLLSQVEWCWHPCLVLNRNWSPFAANSCQMIRTTTIKVHSWLHADNFRLPFSNYFPHNQSTEIFSLLSKVLWNFNWISNSAFQEQNVVCQL